MIWRAVWVVLLLAVATTSTQAQQTGWSVRLGVGAGWSQLRPPPAPHTPGGPIDLTLEEERYPGPTGFVGVGYRLGAHVALGAEARGWMGDTKIGRYDAGRTQVGLFSAVRAYPMGRGLFLKGLLGVTRIRVGETPVSPERSDSGLGYLVGLGFDVRLEGGLVATPSLELGWMHEFEGGRPRVLSVGLSLGVN